MYAIHAHVPTPIDEVNTLVKEGRIGPTPETIIDELKPEAAYLLEIEGVRGGYLVVNMDDVSQIPAMAEPLFLELGATAQISPVFTPDGMDRVAETLQQATPKYG